MGLSRKTDYDSWILRGSESGVLSHQEEAWLEDYDDDQLGHDLTEWLASNPDKAEADFYESKRYELDGRMVNGDSPYEVAQERYLERMRDKWDTYDPY